LHQAVRLAPSDGLAHARLGAAPLSNLRNALIELPDPDTARAVGARAVTLDPSWPEAHVNLGRALFGLGARQETAGCPDNTPLPAFDAWCPLMSLPQRLGSTLTTNPTANGYVTPI